ncbi:MAG TPA: hypothetical protein VK527_02915 [Candidatus Limnocylindrales bacterium]|nr:hypothetical protein [Candidatus Limnocylindrales bacterium]
MGDHLEIVAVEGDVERADGRLDALELADLLGEPLGQGNAARADVTRTRFLAPSFRSMISWAMRVIARRRPSPSTISAFSRMGATGFSVGTENPSRDRKG